MAALDAEAAAVANAANGTRNHRLNVAALKLGGIVVGGYLTADQVRERLYSAAEACGLDKDDGGPQGVLATIESGLSAGMANPRHPPEREPETGARARSTRDGGGETRQRAQEETGERSPVLRLLPFSDDAQPWLEDAWLVEDVLPEQGLGVIFGAPGSRKTFTALDLALHVASDLAQWRRKHVKHRLCIYLSLEGGRPFSNRLTAWRSHHRREAPLFYRCTERLDLRSGDADAERVIAAGKALMKRTGERFGLVVVDTLNRAMPGANENAVEDMGAFIALADAIARDLGCFVLVVHHSGKDAARGSRGHSSLLGAIDTEISLADGVMTITKQRDGEDGLQFGVDLAVVEIGKTAGGKTVTSCVAIEGEASPRMSRKALTREQRQTIEAVREYLDQHGEPNPDGPGWPERGTRRIAETERVIAFLAGKQTSSTPSERKKQAGRKLDRLIEHGIVQTNEGFTWLVR